MQTIKLDLQQQSILTPLKAKQNDRYSRFFKAVLLDGSTAFYIPSGAALMVRYIAPSGCGWYDTITEINGTTTHSAFSLTGNEVTVELAEAMLAMPGSGTLCLQVYAASGYRIGTWNVPIEIEADPLTDSTIAASDYYNVLTWQVAQALGYRDAAANSAQSAAASAALAQQISQQGKGWFATDTALKAAFPTGQNGWWAIVGAGDNIWTWDADTSTWVNTHTQTDLSNYYTKAQADALFPTIQSVTGSVVWENPNDLNSYPAGTISVDQKYIRIKIIYRMHGAATVGFSTLEMFSDGKEYLATGFTALDSVGVTTQLETRTFTLTNGALTVGAGYRKEFSSATGRVVNALSIIPSKIIGYER